MKEHGILFTSAMVRAILAGTKTQTRRAVKFPDGAEYDGHRPDGSEVRCSRPNESTGERVIKAPHGPVGRRLYAKETYGLRSHTDVTSWFRGSIKGWKDAEPWAVDYRADWGSNQEDCFWRPSIHMPRWASRITLEVTRVRVERVGDISEEDARAEGVEPMSCSCCERSNGGCTDGPMGPCCPCCNGTGNGTCAVETYAALWDEINGAGSFAASPWVWVYDFRRARR